MSSEKYLLNSKKDWTKLKKEHQSEYIDCNFHEQPEQYPCVCIVTQRDYSKGPFDTVNYYQVDTFVYLTDFNS